MFKPYCRVDLHGSKYRVREFLAPGHPPTTTYYGSAEEAEQHKRDFRAEAGQLTIGQAVTDYIDYLKRSGGRRRRGMTESGLTMTESKLVNLLGLVDRDAMKRQRGMKNQERVYNDRPLDDLTPSYAQKLYSAQVKLQAEGELAAATHQTRLTAAKGFGQWLQESGKAKENPFGKVMPEGIANKRKDRHGVDQSRKFIAACYEDAHPTGGLACAAMLTLGTRSHELLEREKWDLDKSATVLVIDKSKSEAGERRVALPPVLRAKLRQHVEALEPGALIFGGMTNNTLLQHVKRLCETAGVPVITAHGLRDTWSDLTEEVANRIDQTAKSMGHSDSKVTRAHYMSAGTEQSSRAQMMEELLLSTEAESGESEEQMIERELREAEEKLAALKARKAGAPAQKVALNVGRSPIQPVPYLKSVG